MGLRGPAPQKLDPTARARFLDHLRGHHGRRRSCELAGISYRVMLREAKADPEFACQIREAEGVMAEDILKAFYDEARHPDWRVAHSARRAILNRLGRQEASRRARADRRGRAGAATSMPDAGDVRELVDLILKFVPTDRHEEVVAGLRALAKREEASAPTHDPRTLPIPRANP